MTGKAGQESGSPSADIKQRRVDPIAARTGGDGLMALLNPSPHFGVTSGTDETMTVVRLVLGGGYEEIAACLDGLAIYTDDDLIALLKLGISVASGGIKSELDATDDFCDSPVFAEDVAVLGARLPLAAKALKHLMRQRDNLLGDGESEGYAAEIQAILVGEVKEFQVSGAERDHLVSHATRCLPEDDLATLLSDTGREQGTGEACALSSLPIPRLIEWLKRFVDHDREQLERSHGSTDEDDYRHRLEVIRNMWIRLRRQVAEGSLPAATTSEKA